ncbi:TlpA family protein disulfide reductase [Rufibacter quisquiliarum]|uniref:Thiol-disulfide isomerase/thioredoxin n=1 Tax=Rufibacter quisquiliarum TaxID=1549639 RepID=A0A839GPZ4_9BACT|nr:TlpA disulfide reductase family protein [Rufibacter quisquiliarum]MBA9077595.1 thiol-disulfide isomerase/thioredoxin [Rufibacter quisquiliarum]
MFEKFRVVSSMGGPEGELKSYYDQLAKYLQSQNRFSYYFPRFRFVAASSLNLGFITASAIKRKDAEWASAKEFETNLTLAKSFFDSSLIEPVQYLLLKNPGNQKLANYKEQLLAYTARYPDTDFTSHLQEELAYRESINKNFAGNQLLGQKDATIPLEELMAKKRGKVLYVDFWASWCVPCLEEMPKSLELQEKYKGQPVEFVYLSVDKSRAAWEKGRQRHPKALQTANSFLLLQEFSSPFARGLRLQAIPRYLLIDKAGRIVNANAPRPSEPDLLEKELGKLLR